MIDGNQLREEFGRYLAEHKATRWGMDAALMHVCKIAYDAGKADGPATPERKVGMHPALGAPYGPQAAAEMTDYMKEAERLLDQYDNACLSIIDMTEWQARAALHAHIQRGCYPQAEIMDNNGRGAVPEGWQLVPKAPTEEMLLSGMGDDWPEDVYLRDAYELMLSAAPAPDHFRDAAKMVAEPVDSMGAPISCGKPLCSPNEHHVLCRLHDAPAEVPEPDIKAHLLYCSAPKTAFRTVWKDGIDVEVPAYWVEHFCGRYGDDREAAGYARGLAEAGRDAERYRWLCDVATEQQWVELGGYTVKRIIDGAIDALRGEVK